MAEASDLGLSIELSHASERLELELLFHALVVRQARDELAYRHAASKHNIKLISKFSTVVLLKLRFHLTNYFVQSFLSGLGPNDGGINRVPYRCGYRLEGLLQV